MPLSSLHPPNLSTTSSASSVISAKEDDYDPPVPGSMPEPIVQPHHGGDGLYSTPMSMPEPVPHPHEGSPGNRAAEMTESEDEFWDQDEDLLHIIEGQMRAESPSSSPSMPTPVIPPHSDSGAAQEATISTPALRFAWERDGDEDAKYADLFTRPRYPSSYSQPHSSVHVPEPIVDEGLASLSPEPLAPFPSIPPTHFNSTGASHSDLHWPYQTDHHSQDASAYAATSSASYPPYGIPQPGKVDEVDQSGVGHKPPTFLQYPRPHRPEPVEGGSHDGTAYHTPPVSHQQPQPHEAHRLHHKPYSLQQPSSTPFDEKPEKPTLLEHTAIAKPPVAEHQAKPPSTQMGYHPTPSHIGKVDHNPVQPSPSSQTPPHKPSQTKPTKHEQDNKPSSTSTRPELDHHQQSSQIHTRYVRMLLALDDIPNFWNLLASFFTWILLAGFLLFPGTFTSLQQIADGTNSDLQKKLLNAVTHVPLFVIAFLCCGLGAVGMCWLWWRWMNNYLWLLSKIFVPGFLNALAGVISTIVNVFGVQHGQFSATAKVTIIVTSATAFICGVLTLFFEFWLVRRLKAEHDRQVGTLVAGRHGEGMLKGIMQSRASAKAQA